MLIQTEIAGLLKKDRINPKHWQGQEDTKTVSKASFCSDCVTVTVTQSQCNCRKSHSAVGVTATEILYLFL